MNHSGAATFNGNPGIPDSKLEAAYHKADQAIENIVKLLKAA